MLGCIRIRIRIRQTITCKCLKRTREPDKVGANTETGTGACAYSHSRNEGIENAECCRSGQCNKRNLVEVKSTFRNSKGSKRYHDALNKIFDCALKKFTKIEVIHNINDIHDYTK